MFIDIHTHAMRHAGPRDPDGLGLIQPDQLIERYDEHGIERGVLLPLVSPEGSCGVQAVEDVVEMAKEYDGRFIPFCNLDPRSMTNAADAPLGNTLRYYRDIGCKGLGEATVNLPFLHPMVQNLLKHLQEVQMPITFHVAAQIGGIYGIYDDPGLPQLERSLAAFGDLKFFAHSQTFWAEMAPLEKPGDRYDYPRYPIEAEGVVPKLFRQYANLYGDLSAESGCNALARDPQYAVKFLNEFQDRLMFATDICRTDTPAPLVEFLLKLRDEKKISEEVFQKVARENAIRILNLES